MAGSVADTADETGCLPNFLRFCPATSAASTGQECPFIAFDRPAAVYPEIEQQVIFDNAVSCAGGTAGTCLLEVPAANVS